MIEPTLQALSSIRVILASSSPRRLEIIRNLGINAESVSPNYDENLDRSKYSNHGDYVKDLAYYKVQEVYERLKDDQIPPSLIIGADTVVTVDSDIYGKPKNNEDALKMLLCLANKEHTVFTGVCLKTPEKEIKFSENAKVKIGNITAEQIKAYIKTGEPLDKAGGYGIQGVGGCLIEKIDGDYYTVVGMPVYSLSKHLNDLYSK